MNEDAGNGNKGKPKYSPDTILKKMIEKNFVYHPPKDDQPKRYEEIRRRGKNFAVYLSKNVPYSPELTLAIRDLERCVMFANAAIARHE